MAAPKLEWYRSIAGSNSSALISPRISEGVLRDAKMAFDSGRYATVNERLATAPDSNPVRFLRSLSAYRGLKPKAG